MNLLIKSQRVTPENIEENGHSQSGAAPGAAVEDENVPIDPDLQTIIGRWPGLPNAVKAGMVAMARAAGE